MCNFAAQVKEVVEQEQEGVKPMQGTEEEGFLPEHQLTMKLHCKQAQVPGKHQSAQLLLQDSVWALNKKYERQLRFRSYFYSQNLDVANR
jgi:hypothetical protein